MLTARKQEKELPITDTERQVTQFFLDVQFPISKISKEAYKERKAVAGQTLTGVGKWWGRKPLILVRALILGVLMPTTKNPKLDREMFLKILTMDDGGLWLRKKKNLPPSIIFAKLPVADRKNFFSATSTEKSPKFLNDLDRTKKLVAERKAWDLLSYDEKLDYCVRPEEIAGPSEESWGKINKHLGTKASNIVELVQELGKRRFGHAPRVGDAFCGGGSIPFEGFRLGCVSYGSDLNPVAALLSWGALNIAAAGSKRDAEAIEKAQLKLLKEVDDAILKLGIETNSHGDRAEYYLYCNEVECPECGWIVPLAPSWVISVRQGVIAELVPQKSAKRYAISVREGVTEKEIKDAKASGTVGKSGVLCPNCTTCTPIDSLRSARSGQEGQSNQLRNWAPDEIVPRENDLFQERLYCIRWFSQKGKESGSYFAAPTKADFERETTVLKLLSGRFKEWRNKGLLPSTGIESGYNTDQIIRERGWKYWHQVFNPRQLLINGLISEKIWSAGTSSLERGTCLLFLGRCLDRNSKLSHWIDHHGYGADTFYNQALNTLFNYGCRGLSAFESLIIKPGRQLVSQSTSATIEPKDCRAVSQSCDVWITDPPYADAVNYHELSEFFLGWYAQHLKNIFPEWYEDSKRALAIRGKDLDFKRGMIAGYKQLCKLMPQNGRQIVMFTHQDASVWADLTLILWAAGLRVVSGWCIATETDSAMKTGNYVKGTVCLVLEKQEGDLVAFLDEIYPEVEDEVKKQLYQMTSLEDQEDPNFGDADFQLAAYSAALRVLTKYRKIEDIDVEYELSRSSSSTDESPVVKVIQNAVKIATEYLVPVGIQPTEWKKLTSMERFYLKGLEIESRGEHRDSVFQELARGFGIADYKDLLQSTKANQIRLKTAAEFSRRELGTEGFGTSLLRNVLFGIYEAKRADSVPAGKNWLRNEVPDYWNQRKLIIHLLDYLASMAHKLSYWKEDSELARVLRGAVQNDHV